MGKLVQPSILKSRQTTESSEFNPRIVLHLIFKNWYWFVIATSISLLSTRMYLNHTLPVYRTSATILINETEDRPVVDNSDLLQGLGLPGGMKNMQNQILILKSRALTESTLQNLPFEIEFYHKTIKNKLPIYPQMPIKLISDKDIPLPKDTEFLISFKGDNSFNLQSEADNFIYQKTSNFGDTLEAPGGNFVVICNNDAWLSRNKDKDLFFIIHSRRRLVNSFIRRLNVELVSRDGSILRISLNGTNASKDADFINMHIEGFQSLSLDKKNREAERRVEFIDNQLSGVSDSLSLTESKLQQFRSSNRVMDLSAQGQSIIGQVSRLENERARLSLEANYYDYLADYLNKETSSEIPIVPITMGISDPGLTRLVEELAELQGQLSARGAGEMNPLQRNLEARVRSTKEALKETLNGLRRANSLARSENQQQLNRANSQASALPITERQLLGIERKFQLNNEIYTFLLETRAEQEMQKASNRADSEVIDPADSRYSSIVSPNRSRLNLLALCSGIVVPFVLIYLMVLFNKKLKDEDLMDLSDLPVIGKIPHNSAKTNKVVLENPSAVIAESFRLLRSKLQFFTKETVAPVILVTSTMPGEGKTFTAINLASIYSLLGKSTVLVGFDLRKPMIYEDFNLNNNKGISTWLIGQDEVFDIIQSTKYDNLSIISAGPIPPNPSELTALDKTEELFSLLKKKFEYVIVDSSPIGIVSDTFRLANLADVCLIVVRSGKTLRDMFEHTLNEISEGEVKGVGLVINDIRSTSKFYGYGEKYGYKEEHEHSKKRFLHWKRSRKGS